MPEVCSDCGAKTPADTPVEVAAPQPVVAPVGGFTTPTDPISTAPSSGAPGRSTGEPTGGATGGAATATLPPAAPAYGAGGFILPSEQPYAGIGARIGAIVLDAVIYMALTTALYMIGFAVMGAGSLLGGSILLFFMMIAAPIAYYWVPLALYGQTIGKKALGIKVVCADAFYNAPGFGKIFVRYFVTNVWAMVPFVGMLIDHVSGMADNPERRTIHDRLARTRVIKADYDPYAGQRSSPTAHTSNKGLWLLTVLFVVIGGLLMFAVAIPVFLNQRDLGIQHTMKQDAAETSAVLAQELGAGHDVQLPLLLPPGATTPVGQANVTTSTGNTVLATVMMNAAHTVCLKVTNPETPTVIWADTSTGTIDTTPCDGSAPPTQKAPAAPTQNA